MRFFSPRIPVLLAASALALTAQPRIGSIEIFGQRKTSADKILKLVGAGPGDPLPKSKGDVEERIEKLDGVAEARLEAFCCEAGRPVLYVGVRERGTPAPPRNPYPEKDTALPPEVQSAYADFASALARASAEGDLAEDLTKGHSLLQNLPVRVVQERFEAFAAIYPTLLRDVLAHSADPEQRVMAAYIVGYAAELQPVVPDLQSALQDPDPSVRANAARALRGIIWLAMREPDRGLRVQPTWFVEMLNSVDLSDRLEASRALLLFTEKPDEHTAANIRDRALPSLLEMAAWKHLPHALPAYLVAGRLAGMTDEDLQAAWEKGDRDKTLAAIRKALSRRPGR